MPKPLTVDRLEAGVCNCNNPTCDNRFLYFHGRCHPSDPVQVFYEKGKKVLTVVCAKCNSKVADIVVGEGDRAYDSNTRQN